MNFSLRNVGFALAGVFATAYTLTMPHSPTRSGAESVGQLLGGFLIVFGIPLVLRLVYVKAIRRGRDLRVLSGWLLVVACILAFMVHGSGGSN